MKVTNNPVAKVGATTVPDAGRRNFFKQTVAGAFGAAAMMNIMPQGVSSGEIGRAHV